jgi:hypothetical protein
MGQATKSRIRIRARGKSIGTRLGVWILNGFLRLIHPETLVRTVQAIARGYARFSVWSARYVSAKDRDGLKSAQASGEKEHLKLSQRRAVYYAVPWVALLGTCIYLLVRWPLWMHIPTTDTRITWTLIGEVFVIFFAAPFVIGRQGRRVMAPPPRVGGALTDSLIVIAFNKITLTKKEFTTWWETPSIRGLLPSCHLTEPVTQLKSGKGIKTRVALAHDMKAETVVGQVAEVASKLKVNVSQVFMTVADDNENELELMVLSANPWATPAGPHPLVIAPAELNLWKQDASFATRPTGENYGRRLLSKGGGFGMVIGAIPRQGKTVLLACLMVCIAMDPYSVPMFLDLKGVDFKPFKKITPRGCYLTRCTPDEALSLLNRIIRIINYRIDRLEALGLVNLSEEVARREMPPIWFWVDETSELLDAADKMDEKERKVLVAAFMTIGRLGPTVGVNMAIATQRVNERSVPPGLRDLQPVRFALKCMSAAAARIILGAGGSANRADKLKEKEKGVLITERSELLRTFDVDPETDLEGPAEFGYKLRKRAGTLRYLDPDVLEGKGAPAGVTPDDDEEEDVSTPGDPVLVSAQTHGGRAALVDKVLAIADTEGYGEHVPSLRILAWLKANQGGGIWTPQLLAARLGKHSVRVTKKRHRNPDGSSGPEVRGYLRAELEAVAGPLPTGAVTAIVSQLTRPEPTTASPSQESSRDGVATVDETEPESLPPAGPFAVSQDGQTERVNALPPTSPGSIWGHGGQPVTPQDQGGHDGGSEGSSDPEPGGSPSGGQGGSGS